MLVSFVIPAYNEALLIGRAIGSIRDACETVGLRYEIVVADDASEDATAEIAARLGARVVTARHRQIAATRNSGARAASGALLVFVDADSAVNANLVARTAEAVRGGAIGGGARCAFDGEIPLWSRVIAGIAIPVYAWFGLTPGAYVFATRAAFDAVGGFDESVYGGEEVLFARALRRRGTFEIVRGTVVTSGRKLRTCSPGELFGTLFRLLRGGKRGAGSRDGFELWYGPRRADAGCPVGRVDDRE